MSGPLRSLLGGATELAHARLALLGTELRAELVRSAWLLAGAGAAIGLGLLALAAAGAGVVVAAGEEHRVAALLGVASVFAAAAVLIGWRIQRAFTRQVAAFSGSLGELEADRDALVARSQAARSSLVQAGGELTRLVSIGLLAYSIARRFASKR